MKIKNSFIAIIAAALIGAPGAFAQASQNSQPAQTPRPTYRRAQRSIGARTEENAVQHRVALLTTALSLTPEQQQKATTIFSNAAIEDAAVFAQLRTERRNLMTAERSDAPASQIKQISERIGSDAGQLVDNIATAHQQFYQALNPEQQTKFKQLESEVRNALGFRLNGIMREGF